MKRVHSISTGSLSHERDLLKKISMDDEAAFEELFNAYSVRLAPYAEKLLNSAFWAEEIVQDVFLKIWAGRRELTKVENPSAYIYRMAANKASDFLKKKSLEIKLQYHIIRWAANEKKNFTEQLTDYHFSEKIFAEAVNHLPAQQAQAYRLRHDEDLGYDEISDRLHISKNTVRNHLVAALDNIRNYLLKHEELLVILIFSFRPLQNYFLSA